MNNIKNLKSKSLTIQPGAFWAHQAWGDKIINFVNI